MKSNPEVYPVTRKFEDWIEHPYESFLPDRKDTFQEPFLTYANQLSEMIGEYEHGSCDLSNLDPNITLEQYAKVCQDILLGLESFE